MHGVKAAHFLYVPRMPIIRLFVLGLARDAKSVRLENDFVTSEDGALFY